MLVRLYVFMSECLYVCVLYDCNVKQFAGLYDCVFVGLNVCVRVCVLFVCVCGCMLVCVSACMMVCMCAYVVVGV